MSSPSERTRSAFDWRWAHRVATCSLFGVTPGDPVSYVLAAAAFAAVALAVAVFPAYRASRVDPTTALRYE